MIYIDHFKNQTTYNTIIGGIGGVTDTKAKLATLLLVSESIISKFEVIGVDVYATFTSSYTIIGNAFNANTSITSYIDLNGLVSVLGGGCFSSSSIVNAYFPNATFFSNNTFINCISFTNILYSGVYQCNVNSMTSVAGANFRNTRFKKFIAPNLVTLNNRDNLFQLCSNIELISVKKLKTFGGSPSSESNTFLSIKAGCKIEINLTQSTINSGSPDASLLYAKNTRSAIVEFYDDLGNYVSTL